MKKALVFLSFLCLSLGLSAQSNVYFTSEITPESLVHIFQALGVNPSGTVAVKISTGESAKSNYLRPEFIEGLVNYTGASIVECNTAYGGIRDNTSTHLQVIAERGFDQIAKVDIMDADGEVQIPVEDTTWIKYDIVGSHLISYDFMINLAHFKGHARGGYGGVLKNQSIGMASRHGKCYIHTAGQTTGNIYGSNTQDSFLESMAAAAQAVHDFFHQDGRNIVYINVMNNLSVDCDCNPNPAPPVMADIGILASTDPVALDKACLDLIFDYNSTPGNDAQPLIDRIQELHGTHTVEYAAEIGLGSLQYNLLDVTTTGIQEIDQEHPNPEFLRYNVFSIDGRKLLNNAKSLESLPAGIYIINGQKQVITR
ncbi:MAG: DUF362 domain-containing protein [Bacteroidales bacterium]|nr:DUF362 domain-containing protein [Bacteroidales bacterium]